MRNFIFLVLWLLFVGTANSQIYKWVDINGKVQYSDQPPPVGITTDQKILEIRSSLYSTDGEESSTGDFAEKEQAYKEKRLEREEARNRQLAEAKLKKENCFTAQSNLELLKNSERVSVPDGNGGIIDADDKLRQKYVDEALNNIAKYCQ